MQSHRLSEKVSTQGQTLQTLNPHSDTKRQATTETNLKTTARAFQKQADMNHYNEEPIIQTNKGKEEFIELKTFLPTIPEKMISSRYESPLMSLKMSTSRWKIFTLWLAIFSFTYFSLHLWATLSLANYKVHSVSPQAMLEVSDVLVKMQDMLFYNYTTNIILDCCALAIYLSLVVILLKHNITKIDCSESEEKGRFEKILSRFILLIVMSFALSYIVGTVLIFCATGGHHALIIFHATKLVYLFLNLIAFKQYKSKRFIYEDLLLEAMGPSESGDDKSQIDDSI